MSPGAEFSTHPIRTPDRQKAGSTNWRSQFDRPQARPRRGERAARIILFAAPIINDLRSRAWLKFYRKCSVSARCAGCETGIRHRKRVMPVLPSALAEPVDLRGPTNNASLPGCFSTCVVCRLFARTRVADPLVVELMIDPPSKYKDPWATCMFPPLTAPSLMDAPTPGRIDGHGIEGRVRVIPSVEGPQGPSVS